MLTAIEGPTAYSKVFDTAKEQVPPPGSGEEVQRSRELERKSEIPALVVPSEKEVGRYLAFTLAYASMLANATTPIKPNWEVA